MMFVSMVMINAVLIFSMVMVVVSLYRWRIDSNCTIADFKRVHLQELLQPRTHWGDLLSFWEWLEGEVRGEPALLQEAGHRGGQWNRTGSLQGIMDARQNLGMTKTHPYKDEVTSD